MSSFIWNPFTIKIFCSSISTLSVKLSGILHGDFQGMNVIVPEDFKIVCNTIKYLPPSCASGFLPGFSSSSCTVDSDSHYLTQLLSHLRTCLRPLDSKDLLRTYGLIDYEDISYSYLVLEVGRAIADAMVTFLVKTMHTADSVKNCLLQSEVTLSNLERESPTVVHGMTSKSQSHDTIKSEVLKIGGWMICGYLTTNNLSKEEYNVIFPAVLTSLCQYYILGKETERL